MSEQTEQNRSEAPSQFKLTRAREKGSVARGMDLGFLTSLAAFFGFAWVTGPSLVALLSQTMAHAFVSAPGVLLEGNAALALTGAVLTSPLRLLIILAATVFAVVLLFELVQTGVVFSAQPLQPDFSRLSPAKGFKRVFSLRMLIETAKNVLKIASYAAIAYFLIREAALKESLSITDAASLAHALNDMSLRLLATFLGGALVFAALDQLIVRHEFLKQMRMSRREVRRESRDREGEPRLKQKRKKLHAEFVKLSQSLRDIRGADVLITNPNHFAVALRYDGRTMTAPKIVSQGAHGFAQRLKRLAFIYGVTVVRRPELARALYRQGQLGAEIPETLYQAVADIYLEMRANAAKARSSSDA